MISTPGATTAPSPLRFVPMSSFRRPRLPRRLAVLFALILAACSDAPSAPSPAATLTIGPTGIDRQDVRIKAWDFVTFVNNDVRPHTIVSDPVDAHSQCPQINRVGVLQPGERRETGSLELKRICGFHDHNDPSDRSFQGRIVVE